MIVDTEVIYADSSINIPEHTHKSAKVRSCIIQLCIFKSWVSCICNSGSLVFFVTEVPCLPEYKARTFSLSIICKTGS